MKYCMKCGNEILEEAVICPKCGCKTDYNEEPKIDSSSSVLGIISIIGGAIIPLVGWI